MYSRLQLASKYIRYSITASNGKGHGIHSPFVFDFIQHVLNDFRHYPEYEAIETMRRQLEGDDRMISVEDLGAGSLSKAMSNRRISNIAQRAAKPKKLGQLLFRIARYYCPDRVLELGTSLGLSTAYLAAGARIGGSSDRKMFTIEGASEVGAIAMRNFHSLGMGNIDLTIGNFDVVLGNTLERAGHIDLAFVDGNHRLEPTLRYFDALYGRLSPSSVLIFDDIHWSPEMEAAWESIKGNSRVYLTIDLFFIGLVFFRDTFKVKQDFVIRF